MTQCSLLPVINQVEYVPDGGTSDWGCLLIQHSEYQGPAEEIITWFIMCTVCKHCMQGVCIQVCGVLCCVRV